jgi:hypothetical protein
MAITVIKAIRKTGPEVLRWPLVGSGSIGLAEIPLGAFELRDVKVRLNIDEIPAEKRFIGSANLQDRKSDEKNQYFKTKTASECYKELTNRFPDINFEILETTKRQAPKESDFKALGRTRKEIKANLRKAVKALHPDRVANASPEEQKEATEKMAGILSIYQRLKGYEDRT